MKETITLKHPIEFEGKEVTELTLEFDKLTGQDLEDCYMQLTDVPKVAELDRIFQAQVSARAANVPIELIRSLKAKDYTRITVKTQNFLLN